MIRYHGQQETDNLAQALDAVSRQLFTEDVPSFEVPIAGLPRGTQTIFIEVRSFSAATSRISFRNVRADRPNSSEKLIDECSGSPILIKCSGILPREVRQEQSDTVGSQFPDGVGPYLLRNMVSPFFIAQHRRSFAARSVLRFTQLRFTRFFLPFFRGATPTASQARAARRPPRSRNPPR